MKLINSSLIEEDIKSQASIHKVSLVSINRGKKKCRHTNISNKYGDSGHDPTRARGKVLSDHYTSRADKGDIYWTKHASSTHSNEKQIKYGGENHEQSNYRSFRADNIHKYN